MIYYVYYILTFATSDVRHTMCSFPNCVPGSFNSRGDRVHMAASGNRNKSFTRHGSVELGSFSLIVMSKPGTTICSRVQKKDNLKYCHINLERVHMHIFQ